MADMSRTFVTGFGPFGDITDNPSTRLAEASNRNHAILEVSYSAVDAFLAQFDPSSFDRLIMLGVAAGRKQITPELFARNTIGARPDVKGTHRIGDIEPGGPVLLEGTLWTPETLSQLLIGRPIEASMDAGTYLCNFIYYRALRTFPEKRVGFLHVPNITEMPLEEQTPVVNACIEATES